MLRDWAKFAGFSAILAFVLTATFCFALRPPVQTNQRAEQTKQRSDAPLIEAANEPSFVIFRVILPGGLEQISAYCNSYSEEEKKKWPQAYYCELKVTDVWLSIFTCLLVFVTGGIVWTAYRQETMARTHERAYVFGGGPVQVHKRGIAVADKGTMSIENYGRTPATVSVIEWGLCDEGKFPKDIPVSRIIDENLLPEGIVQRLSVQNVLPPNLPPSIFSEKIEFSHTDNVGKIFFGRFNYKDVFGDDHYSTFKLRLTKEGSEGLEGCYTDWK